MAETRPAPWSPPRRAGFHYEAVEQGPEWVVPACGAGRCRFTVGPNRQTCKKPPAASLMRSRYGRNSTSRVPWDYCEEHLYGRWIEDGKVMGWRLVRHDGGDTGADLARILGGTS